MFSHDSQSRASLCAFTFADSRQCRMLRSSRRSRYCVYHQRKLRYIDNAKDAAMDIFEPISGGSVSAAALTKSLSRILACVAEGRINAKDAVEMTRVAETLLKTIPLPTSEFQDCYLYRCWAQLVRHSFGKLPDYILPDSQSDEEDDSDDPDESDDSRQTDNENFSFDLSTSPS